MVVVVRRFVLLRVGKAGRMVVVVVVVQGLEFDAVGRCRCRHRGAGPVRGAGEARGGRGDRVVAGRQQSAEVVVLWCWVPVVDDGLEVVDWGAGHQGEGSEAAFCGVDGQVRWCCCCCCAGGEGVVGLSLLPFHVAGDDAGEAGGEGEHDANVVTGLDVLAWVARRGCDDENEHCGGDDEGEMEERGERDEREVA